MKESLEKINFKKVFQIFICTGIGLLVLSLVYVVTFSNHNWTAVGEVENIKYNMKNGTYNVEMLHADIDDIKADYPEIIDILIVDRDGSITYSAMNSQFAKNETFDVDQYQTQRKGRSRPFNHRGAKHDNNINVTVNAATQEKLVVISKQNIIWKIGTKIQARLVALSFGVIDIIGYIFCIALRILMALWVYVDSKKTNRYSFLWTLLVAFNGMFALAVYYLSGLLIKRSKEKRNKLKGDDEKLNDL